MTLEQIARIYLDDSSSDDDDPTHDDHLHDIKTEVTVKDEPIVVKGEIRDNGEPQDRVSAEIQDEGGGVHQVYTCPFCFELFPKADELIDHLPEHTSPGNIKKRVKRESSKIFNCRKCPYSSYAIGPLRKHVKIHQRQGKSFMCSHCPSYFLTRPGLLLHETHIHNITTGSSSKCLKSMASPPTTQSNQLEGIRQTKPEDKIPKLILTRCDHLLPKRGTASPISLNSETNLQVRKPNPFVAVEVKKESKGPPSQELKELVEVVPVLVGQQPKKGFRCKLCQKIFSHKKNAYIHIKTIHWGEKEFGCTVCPKKFATKQQLGYHSMIHSGLKPYPCTLCSKTFNIPSNLKVHIMFHKKIQPHKCQRCSKCFTRPADMRKHALTHGRLQNQRKCK